MIILAWLIKRIAHAAYRHIQIVMRVLCSYKLQPLGQELLKLVVDRNLPMAILRFSFPQKLSVGSPNVKNIQKGTLRVVNERNNILPKQLSAFRRPSPRITDDRGSNGPSIVQRIIVDCFHELFTLPDRQRPRPIRSLLLQRGKLRLRRL